MFRMHALILAIVLIKIVEDYVKKNLAEKKDIFLNNTSLKIVINDL